jgi:hypothetical protein
MLSKVIVAAALAVTAAAAPQASSGLPAKGDGPMGGIFGMGPAPAGLTGAKGSPRGV